MIGLGLFVLLFYVALYTSAWIEIPHNEIVGMLSLVALYTSAWIEITVEK